MKLALVLADSTLSEKGGKVSALGLGVTHLYVEKLPSQFRGGVVIIMTFDAGDQEAHNFSMTLAGPVGGPQQFAAGTITRTRPHEQVVLAHSFDMLIGGLGTYVFRIDCGGASAEARLIVQDSEKGVDGMMPPAQESHK